MTVTLPLPGPERQSPVRRARADRPCAAARSAVSNSAPHRRGGHTACTDYPLQEVGRLTLNRNPSDYHTEIEQAAFEPNNLIAGTGLSPDKMLLARGFSYSDAHRARLGVNYRQIPVNPPTVPVHSYSKDGHMRVRNAHDRVYAPNSYGGPTEDPSLTDDGGLW